MKRLLFLISLGVLLYGIYEGVLGVAQMFGFVDSNHPVFPVTGSFYNPGPFGCCIGSIVPMAVFMHLAPYPRWVKALSALYAVLAAMLLPGALSRTGWLSAAAGSAVVVGAMYAPLIRKLRRRTVAIGCVGAVLLGSVAVKSAYDLKSDSADGRLLMWKIAWRASCEAPEGVGWEYLPGAYGDAQESYFAAGAGTETERMVAETPVYVFNEYLQLALAFGRIWALLFAALMAMTIWIYIRRREYGLAGVASAFAVTCMASYPLQFVGFRVLAVVLFAGACLLLKRRMAAVICLGLVGLLGWRLFTETTGRNIEEDFKTALYMNKKGEYEASNQLLLSLMPFTSDPMPLNIIGKNYQAMSMPDSARHYFMRAAARVPNRLYPHYLLMKLYAETPGDSSAMIGEARYILSAPIKVPSPAVDEMRHEADSILQTLSSAGTPPLQGVEP